MGQVRARADVGRILGGWVAGAHHRASLSSTEPFRWRGLLSLLKAAYVRAYARGAIRLRRGSLLLLLLLGGIRA